MSEKIIEFHFESHSGRVLGQSWVRVQTSKAGATIENRWVFGRRQGEMRVSVVQSRMQRLQLRLTDNFGDGRNEFSHLWLEKKKTHWLLTREKLGKVWSQRLDLPSDLLPFGNGMMAGYFMLHIRGSKGRPGPCAYYNPDRLWAGSLKRKSLRKSGGENKHLKKEVFQFVPNCKVLREPVRTSNITWDNDGPDHIEYPHLGLVVQKGCLNGKFSAVKMRAVPVPNLSMKPWIKPTKEEEVFFRSADNTRLAGSLMLPNRGQPRVAVVLVHGSGPENRDTGSGYEQRDIDTSPCLPFLELSRTFSQQGVATFRYDKRGVGKSGGRWSGATPGALTEDVVAAVQWVHRRLGLPVFVIGTSEGAKLAFQASLKTKMVAGIVAMSGPSRSLDKVVLAKTRKKLKRLGFSSSVVRQELSRFEDFFMHIRKFSRSGAKPSKDLMVMNFPYLWWVEHLSIDPGRVAQKSKVPVLLLHGREDVEVLPEEQTNLCRMLRKRKTQVETHLFPKLNHFLVPSCLRSPTYEYDIPQEIPKYVTDIVEKWLGKQLKNG